MSQYSLPVHAERVPGEESALLWHLPGTSLPVGRVVQAPGLLGELLAQGTLTKGLSAAGLLWLWVGPDTSWSDVGQSVRDALPLAADCPDEWGVTPAGREVLTQVTEHVLDGSLAAYIASHGGRVVVTGVNEDSVEFSFEGACTHCPVADVTLHTRIENSIRQFYPALSHVMMAASGTDARPRGWWKLRSRV